MNTEAVALIQSSWAKVIPIQAQAAELFYGRLFELDPSLKALFRIDLVEQGDKLTSMITVVVNGLSRLETLVPAVQALGKRHLTYGVKDAHYETVGDALLWTLERGLGDGFTPDVKTAWASAYGLLASTMKTAAAVS
jgi:hemoglobin-like flavoprotein